MKTLLLIGIGAGAPEHLTLQAVEALRRADVFLLLDKGPAKAQLLASRQALLAAHVPPGTYRLAEALHPQREPKADYRASVAELNAGKQALLEQLLREQVNEGETAALLVWGDPALYDSSLRIAQCIAEAGRVALDYQVIPGITSVQALAAAHRVALNEIAGSVVLTTGRRLALGLPADAESIVVLLDAHNSFLSLNTPGLHIFWGAYLGLPQQALIAGPLADVGPRIARERRALRERHGWIMDTYLLRRVRA
ncbi:MULTISPECIES: precorrin-6A synthase (deacetylating) [unclassified Pseudomonas]|uniref:precorrin-6A synthase (deacetylating) n=1 Tax=unclassified Pseudomonas TaxID=196821 RepID=UPI000BD52E67|nr:MULTISPECIES: precorrin-6A synthase (deacetylating) [unclassified Pseudomonas]PVZ20640.1 precorrin-6A synthase (deacetylating) [Pseudomonas sp. URIL14HWK12:I12]PVZ27706.1 precorrin-6A synthase (deacetylating) [Pseudomonas sp. URIL14HWK12:I10]PVZ38595.1 precorrin-6A synthase (deacetylating) [Pseudomonas sp. URIL14HWK12:I11]SNZ02731.1 precorrin-6A synthase (deacetylating) [Pseudomonas sp. URIL14HWK12:I9]